MHPGVGELSGKFGRKGMYLRGLEEAKGWRVRCELNPVGKAGCSRRGRGLRVLRVCVLVGFEADEREVEAEVDMVGYR